MNFTSRILATAIDLANIVPWKWNLKTHIIQYEMADLSGLQTDYNIQNKEFKEVSETEYFAMIHPDDRVKMYKALKQLSTDKTARMKETYRLVYEETGNKRIEWIQLQASVDKYDEKREAMILIGVALVITPFKQLEEELIKARFRAEESNRLKSAFLANISHEIRTPLNAIVGFSELLLTEENAKTQQEYTNIIKTNTELLLQLINDVLDLSKIETGKLEFTNTIFDLNNLISEIEDIMHLRLKNNQVQFQIELPQSSCMIRSEKNRLTQVLTNLLNNSIKFTSQGYIKFGYSLDGQMLYFLSKIQAAVFLQTD